MIQLRWKQEPNAEDYQDALQYLTLRYNGDVAYLLVNKLRRAPVKMFQASDILRASGLEPAPHHDPEVQRLLVKATQGIPLDPALVVHFERGMDIANGYHHVSLATHVAPVDAMPAKIAHLRIQP